MSSWVRNSNFKLKQSVKQPQKSNAIAIIVCVNFADKLKVSLASNTGLLNKIYVVTDPLDKPTLEVCKQYTNVSVILCSDAYKNNAKFNKSGLIKYAQVTIIPNHREDWIIIIDADTILPSNFWSETIKGRFIEDTVYLLKRKIYKSIEDVKTDTYSEIQHGCGFFQMYYKKTRMYGDFSESAAVCDILFQQLFRHQKELDGFCIHLGQNGLDWNGRKSEEWT
jgi:hypothetical protein